MKGQPVIITQKRKDEEGVRLGCAINLKQKEKGAAKKKMNGYEYIKSLSADELSKQIGLSRAAAVVVLKMGKEELIKSPVTCPQLLTIKAKWQCNFHETSCKECMKEFLENEVPGTSIKKKKLPKPCKECMERDFCQGEYRCRKLKEYLANG